MRRLQEMPTHPALEEKASWSASAMTPAQRRSALDALTSESVAATAAARGRLLKGRPYVGPVRREQAFTAQMRAVRSGVAVAAPGLLSASVAPHLAATGGLGADLTHGLDLGSALAHGHPLAHALQPTGEGRHLGRRGAGGGVRLAVSYSHDGSYGPVSAADPGAGAHWSCCGAADRESRGCHVVSRSLDRPIYDSPFGR